MLRGVGATPALLDPLPLTDNGLDAVRDTLRKMVAIVRKYRTDVTTATVARKLLTAAGVADVRTNKPLVIRTLHAWVRDTIVYVPDPRGVEMIQTPVRTLAIRTGDCDDKAILIASLLESIGAVTRFLAVGGSGREWGNWCTGADIPPYSHVLAQVQIGSGWVTLETIVPGAPVGFFPQGVQVLMPARV